MQNTIKINSNPVLTIYYVLQCVYSNEFPIVFLHFIFYGKIYWFNIWRQIWMQIVVAIAFTFFLLCIDWKLIEMIKRSIEQIDCHSFNKKKNDKELMNPNCSDLTFIYLNSKNEFIFKPFVLWQFYLIYENLQKHEFPLSSIKRNIV